MGYRERVAAFCLAATAIIPFGANFLSDAPTVYEVNPLASIVGGADSSGSGWWVDRSSGGVDDTGLAEDGRLYDGGSATDVVNLF